MHKLGIYTFTENCSGHKLDLGNTSGVFYSRELGNQFLPNKTKTIILTGAHTAEKHDKN
jgi:hypothetical protein